MNTVKCCERCGEPLKEHIFPNGRKAPPSYYAKRRWCSTLCARLTRAEQEGCLPTSGRKRAQRLFSTQSASCEVCSKSAPEVRIDRHHRDGNTLNNAPANISFRCAGCHTKTHWDDGTLVPWNIKQKEKSDRIALDVHEMYAAGRPVAEIMKKHEITEGTLYAIVTPNRCVRRASTG